MHQRVYSRLASRTHLQRRSCVEGWRAREWAGWKPGSKTHERTSQIDLQRSHGRRRAVILVSPRGRQRKASVSANSCFAVGSFGTAAQKNVKLLVGLATQPGWNPACLTSNRSAVVQKLRH